MRACSQKELFSSLASEQLRKFETSTSPMLSPCQALIRCLLPIYVLASSLCHPAITPCPTVHRETCSCTLVLHSFVKLAYFYEFTIHTGTHTHTHAHDSTQHPLALTHTHTHTNTLSLMHSKYACCNICISYRCTRCPASPYQTTVWPSSTRGGTWSPSRSHRMRCGP